ncbi:hypothetical protein ACQRBK_06375 [Peptoniphilaceae bacterium SGI.137]
MKHTTGKAIAVFLGLFLALTACGKTDSQKGSAEGKESKTLSVSSSESTEKESLTVSASSLSSGAEEAASLEERLSEEAKAGSSETRTEKSKSSVSAKSAASLQPKASGSPETGSSKTPKMATALKPSPSFSQKRSSEAASEKPHQHTWKAVYKTVEVPETGHTEKKLIKASWTEEVPKYDMVCHVIINGSNEDVTGLSNIEIAERSDKNGGLGSWREEYRYEQVGTTSVVHDAEYEDVYVVDSPATTRQEFSHYECTDCGAVR